MPNTGKTFQINPRKTAVYVRPAFIAIAAVILLPVLAILALHVPAVQKEIIVHAANKIENSTHFRVGLESFMWWPFSSLDLEKVRVEAEGKKVLDCEKVRFEYTLSTSRPYLNLPEIYLEKPFLQLEKNPDGKWRVPVKPVAKRSDYSAWLNLPLPIIRISSGMIEGRRQGKVILLVKDVTGVLHLERIQGPEGPEIRIDADNWQGLAGIFTEAQGTAEGLANTGETGP